MAGLLSRPPIPFLLAGDFNCHHYSWGSTVSDSHGLNLLQAVEDENLVIVNDGSPTRLTPPNAPSSAVDLCIVSSNIAPLVDWKVSDDLLGSDHFVIINSLSMPGNFQSYNFRSHASTDRWNLKQADWKSYQSCIEHLTNQASLTEDYSYDTFIANLEEASNQFIPKINANNNTRQFRNHWWSINCQIAVEKRKEKMQIYKNNPTMHNLIQYKNAAAMVKKTILESKRSAWRKFCLNLNKNTPIKHVWSEIKKLKRTMTGPVQQVSLGDWSGAFLNSLAPAFVPHSINSIINDRVESSSQSNYLTNPINFRELELALKNKVNSSPGMDNVHYPMLSHLPTNAKIMLITIFNNILQLASPPTQWKKIKIIPVLKPNKDQLVASSYRPISLASCVLKTFERIIKNRLSWWLSESNLWPRTQFGFRRHYSTNDAFLQLTSDIQQSFSENKSVVALFIDIKGAYDSVQLHLLATKMLALGIPQLIVRLIYKIYSDRELYLFTSESMLGPQTANIGLAQGTILSPLCYVLFAHDLEKIVPNNIKIIQYADDVCLYVANKSIENCLQSLDQTLLRVSEWMSSNGLEISYNKTSVTTFSHTRAESPEYVTLNNTRIKHTNSTTFLGLHMDRKLTWRVHINNIIKKTEKSINILRMISSLKWSADPSISLLVYRSYIRSVIDYGSSAYGNASDSLLKKLDVIHNRCLRLCLGLLNDTPINALLSEAGEMPLLLRRKKLCMNFLINCYRKSSPMVNKIQQLLMEDLTSRFWIIKKSPLLVQCQYILQNNQNQLSIALSDNVDQLNYSDIITPLHCRYYSLSTQNIGTINNLDFRKFIDTHYKDYYTYYTDGSSRDGKYGCAWFDYQTNKHKIFRLDNVMTVYTSELIAILECLNYIKKSKLSNKYLIITDSKSAVDQLGNISFSSSVNPVIVKIVQLVHTMNLDIKILWVKGHSGVAGNERVDQLAKQACIQNKFNNTIITIPDLRTSLINNIYNENIEFYKNYNKGLFYISIQGIPSRKPWFSNCLSTNKNFIRILSRLRTNHGICLKYLHLIGKAPSDLCDCGEVGNLEHTLMICPNFSNQRMVLFDSLAKLSPLPFNYKSLLASADEEIYSHIYKFVVENGIRV